MKVGYLGPKGTFTEQACICYAGDAERIPFVTIQDALLAVESGEIDRCVAPIENSIEGMVNATTDALVFDRNLYIEKQIVLPIEQNIMVKKGFQKEDIRKIISHPHAIPQVRKFLEANMAGISEETVSSTAEAARLVSVSDGSVAAVCPKLAGEIYGLDMLYAGVQDSDKNRTSFIAVTKENTEKPVKGNIASIVFGTDNKPGTLYKILDIFSIWDINMTKIFSRPMKEKPGEYVFLVDIEISDIDDTIDALRVIKRKTDFFKNLGSYPIETFVKTQ